MAPQYFVNHGGPDPGRTTRHGTTETSAPRRANSFDRDLICAGLPTAIATFIIVLTVTACSRGTAGPIDGSTTALLGQETSATTVSENAESENASSESTEPTPPDRAGVTEDSPLASKTETAIADNNNSAQFLFSSNRTGVYQLYLFDNDEITPITTDEDFDSWAPRLAPDGSRLVFSRAPVAERPVVGSPADNYRSASAWTIRLDGSGKRELLPATRFRELGPMSWSPDGKSVVFSAVDPEDNQFHLWTADTSEFRPKKLTSRQSLFLDPAFGPDGSQISYVSFPQDYEGRETDKLEVFRLDLDEMIEERLTFDGFEDGNPSWSPDGEHIAFETIVDRNYLFQGKWAIRSITASSGEIETLLSDGNVNRLPRWAPNGSQLLFQQLIQGEGGFRLSSISVESGELVASIGPDSSADQIDIDPINVALD